MLRLYPYRTGTTVLAALARKSPFGMVSTRSRSAVASVKAGAPEETRSKPSEAQAADMAVKAQLGTIRGEGAASLLAPTGTKQEAGSATTARKAKSKKGPYTVKAAASEPQDTTLAPRRRKRRRADDEEQPDEFLLPEAVKVTQSTAVQDLVSGFSPSAKRFFVGAHVSMGGGIERAVVNAASIGARAFALDTRSKRQWESKPLAADNAAAFIQACTTFGFSPDHIVPHGSYLINLGSSDAALAAKSYTAFLDELHRCEDLGLRLYNFHPGWAKGWASREEAMEQVADAINRAHNETQGVRILLENMSGQGSALGSSFEELRFMINHVQDQSRVGVTLDTCHLWAAGFDIQSKAGWDAVVADFSRIVGWHHLAAMHINDSKEGLGKKRDRHENIGRGTLQLNFFRHLMNDERLAGLPLIMETPVQCGGPRVNYRKSLEMGALVLQQTEEEAGESTDKRDIALLYSLCQ